jgi:hypothetical protein
MARRSDPEKPDFLSAEDIKQRRQGSAHLSPDVRQFCQLSDTGELEFEAFGRLNGLAEPSMALLLGIDIANPRRH